MAKPPARRAGTVRGGRKFGVFADYPRLLGIHHGHFAKTDPAHFVAANAAPVSQTAGVMAGRLPCAAMAGALFLSACALPDDQALTMINRGKYSLYDCYAIATQAREKSARERELATAIEKASRGPGGELIVNTVYRPEYLTVKGELQELELTANKKNCRNALRTQSDGVIQ